MSEWQTVDVGDLRPQLVFTSPELAEDREAQEWLAHVNVIVDDETGGRTEGCWPTRDAAASEEDG